MAAPTKKTTCEQYEWVDEMVDDIANGLPHCWHFREDCRHSHFRLYSLLGSAASSRSRDRQRAFQEFDMISIYGCQNKITRWDTKSSFAFSSEDGPIWTMRPSFVIALPHLEWVDGSRPSVISPMVRPQERKRTLQL
jgi:hypothetical protein